MRNGKTRDLCMWLAVAFIFWILAPAGAWANDQETFEITILGDTHFGESYHDRLASEGHEPVLRTRGYDYMIEKFQELLANSDLTVANLETPITDKFPSPFAGVRKYVHYADVTKTPESLKKYGVDLVSLANNHAMDYGLAGLEQTLNTLALNDVESCGAGLNLEEAKKPFVNRIEIGQNVLHLAFLCMFEYRKHYDEKFRFYARADAAGTYAISQAGVSAEVAELKQKYENLFVIAFPHWGQNYVWATDAQKRQARGLIDAGVDLIIGHGPHMLQEVERYKERWVVYSIGNFVFGSPGRYQKMQAPPYSSVARLSLATSENSVTKKLRLYPIMTDNQLTKYQGRFATAREFNYVSEFLSALSWNQQEFSIATQASKDRFGHFIELVVD